MVYKVDAAKMGSAISDEVKKRNSGIADDAAAIDKVIVDGVTAHGEGGAAVKGTKLQFTCSPSGVELSVNGTAAGSVPSGALAAAVCELFLDANAMSPAMLDSILEANCAA